MGQVPLGRSRCEQGHICRQGGTSEKKSQIRANLKDDYVSFYASAVDELELETEEIIEVARVDIAYIPRAGREYPSGWVD